MALRIGARAQRRKRWQLLGISLGFVFLCFWVLINQAPESRAVTTTTPIVVASFDTIKVPVPIAYVPAGTKIKDVQVKYIEYPTHQVPVGALTNLSPYQESVSITALPSNLPLFPENIATNRATGNAVVERIPQGMRAMTIQVDATSSVEGWAGSGSIVDVLLVERESTSVVAESVKILSAERSVSPIEVTPSATIPRTVTILVTQNQCLAINTAIPRGGIALALRSNNDAEPWDLKAYRADELKGGAAPSGSQITGFLSMQDGNRKFVFANGKWTASNIVPDGFRLIPDKDS